MQCKYGIYSRNRQVFRVVSCNLIQIPLIQYLALILECSWHSVYVCPYYGYSETYSERLRGLPWGHSPEASAPWEGHPHPSDCPPQDCQVRLRQAPLPERCCRNLRLLRPPPRPHPPSVTSAKSTSKNSALPASPNHTSAGATSWTIGSSGTHTTSRFWKPMADASTLTNSKKPIWSISMNGKRTWSNLQTYYNCLRYSYAFLTIPDMSILLCFKNSK